MEENGESAKENGLKQRMVQQAEEEKAQQQLDSMLRVLLDMDARQRLSNVRIANQPLYLKTVQMLLSLYKAGHINGKISDEQLKKILEKVNEGKREPTIRRK